MLIVNVLTHTADYTVGDATVVNVMIAMECACSFNCEPQKTVCLSAADVTSAIGLHVAIVLHISSRWLSHYSEKTPPPSDDGGGGMV